MLKPLIAVGSDLFSEGKSTCGEVVLAAKQEVTATAEEDDDETKGEKDE